MKAKQMFEELGLEEKEEKTCTKQYICKNTKFFNIVGDIKVDFYKNKYIVFRGVIKVRNYVKTLEWQELEIIPTELKKAINKQLDELKETNKGDNNEK